MNFGKGFLVVLFATIVISCLNSGLAHALPQYAEAVDKDCTYCHVELTGGEALTAEGLKFREFIFGTEEDESTNEPEKTTPVREKIFWLLVGFVHFCAGFIWLGTIIYIHLVLKPAYAASGLPKSELKLAWLCMSLIGLTGLLLTFRDFSSLNMMLSSSFGKIILAKIVVFSTMLSTAAFVTLFIGPRIKKKIQTADISDIDLTRGITAAQLAGFDGQDSRSAYVVVDGKVYDVSESRLWKGGVHMKRHRAGEEMSAAIADAPHGKEVMQRVPEISQLVPSDDPQETIKKVFYFLAYSNLIFVFVIIFLLSLLRFWRFS